MIMNRTLAAGAIVLAVAMLPSPGLAQGESALEVVERLNTEAMEAYFNMDIERAGSMLEEALRVAEDGGVAGRPYALTNINLAVVYIGGLGDTAGGREYFQAAVCAAPDIELDPLHSTPEIQDVFDEAQSAAQASGCQAGGGALPVTSPVAPSNVAPAPAPAGGYGPPSLDDETPWDEADRPTLERPQDFKRFYFQAQFALGLAMIQPGMKADRVPPSSATFWSLPSQNDLANDPTLDQNDPQFTVADPVALYIRNQTAEDPADIRPLRLREDTPWVPDGDSEDDLMGSFGGECTGDGELTGPRVIAREAQALATVDRTAESYQTDPTFVRDNLLPTQYCVRVNSQGLAATTALRFALGYFVTDTIGLGATVRLQLDSGLGTAANIMFGPRLEFMLTSVKPTGLMISMFLGGTFGQLQVPSPGTLSDVESPWIVSGLFGANAGVGIRYRFVKNFGVVLSPELDLQFPDLLFNIDLPIGLEVAFL